MKGVVRFFQIFCLLLLWASNCHADEFRGLWVDAFGPGFFNSNQVAKLVSDCRKYNFNAVIVEMRDRGDAFYMPHLPNEDIRRTAIATNYDALADIINQCHNGSPRIEVHCWVVAQYIWANKNRPWVKNHVFNTHPEFLTKDALGQTFIEKGYFLDPGNPDACQWNYNMAVDIVSHYDIDGFHWDYIRYPNQNSGYNETAIKRYNAEFGLTGQPSYKDPQFSAWRRRQVTDFLRWVNADLLVINPKLLISASVFANHPDAYGFRFQDWVEWNKEGIIDVCIPMDFSTNNNQIFIPRAEFALTNQWARKVYLGQGAYMQSKEDTLEQLQYIRNQGFNGYAFYSYRTPNRGQKDQVSTFGFLKEEFQTNWASTPVLPWKKEPSKAIIKGTVTQGKGGEPVYNADVLLQGVVTRSQKTEPHGHYAFFEVPPGEYDLIVKSGKLSSATNRVRVKAGEILNLDGALEP